MVSFRLSEEEYEELKHICATIGARSLSDIARDAVHRLLDDGVEPKRDLETELRRLSQKMEAIDNEVKRLAGIVHQPAEHHAMFDTVNL
jgi:Ribbon-helix-helix protein, copG family